MCAKELALDIVNALTSVYLQYCRFDVNIVTCNTSFWYCVIELYVTNVRQHAVTYHILLSSSFFNNHGSSFEAPSQNRIINCLQSYHSVQGSEDFH